MGKREDYINKLEPLMILPSRISEMEDFLISNSNLPGPRGNLELADAFADAVELTGFRQDMWNDILTWLNITPEEAPAGHPREFLPFCAVLSLGALYGLVNEEEKGKIVKQIQERACDERWRTRESVAMAFQRIGEKDFNSVRRIFNQWMKEASLVEQRAILAALAHPPMLNSRENTEFCLKVADQILEKLAWLDRSARKKEEFKILKKGLDYAISVFVERLPSEGFDLLKKWALVEDLDIQRIVKSNISKNRLTKKYPIEVKEVSEMLQISEKSV
ncbi:hypothetical protein HNQ80_004016 [Anaerosolibacter carboniphilus]|uniref:DNA alkylation repair enzyme n=1 Tax=Anaerosolibacter carboniphilus TaxID=1417629 RepID=A0A841L118_9FIRM|nr:hypothetical protein [Anaerosolibacter carboniphilus]MBB6217880.1 hypothetical protein [Anaerosolibacter carboniphilus]